MTGGAMWRCAGGVGVATGRGVAADTTWAAFAVGGATGAAGTAGAAC